MLLVCVTYLRIRIRIFALMLVEILVVLRIRDVYPGSEFFHPGSELFYPGFRIRIKEF
jgi:hypothetical protein